jgi:hypothetical protein
VLQIGGSSLVFAEGGGSPAVGGNVVMAIYYLYRSMVTKYSISI